MGLSCCLVLEAASCLIASRKCEVPTHAPDSSCARTPYALLGQGPNIVIVASRAGLLVLRTSTSYTSCQTPHYLPVNTPTFAMQSSSSVAWGGWRGILLASRRALTDTVSGIWILLGRDCLHRNASVDAAATHTSPYCYSYCCCCRSRYWLRQLEPLAPGEIESPEPWTVPFATGHNDLSVQLPAAMGNRQAATPFLFQVGWRDLLRLY